MGAAASWDERREREREAGAARDTSDALGRRPPGWWQARAIGGRVPSGAGTRARAWRAPRPRRTRPGRTCASPVRSAEPDGPPRLRVTSVLAPPCALSQGLVPSPGSPRPLPGPAPRRGHWVQLTLSTQEEVPRQEEVFIL